MRSLLTTVFKLLQDGWVRDFVFKGDAITDISALTSPIQLQHAVAAECYASCYDPSGKYHGLFDNDVTCTWLLVPVFSVGELGVGIVLQEKENSTNRNLCSEKSQSSYVRIVRSTVDGSFVSVLDDHERNEIVIVYMSNISTVRRKRVFLRCRRDLLRNAMSSTSQIDLGLAQQAILIVHDAEEVRFCPKCSAPPTDACGCKFTFLRPKHPIDYTHVTSSLVCHRGEFAGVARISLLSEGFPCAIGKLCAKSAIRSSTEPGVVYKLSRWGVQARMKEVAIAPPPLLSAVRLTKDIAAALGYHPSNVSAFQEESASDSLESLLAGDTVQPSSERQSNGCSLLQAPHMPVNNILQHSNLEGEVALDMTDCPSTENIAGAASAEEAVSDFSKTSTGDRADYRGPMLQQDNQRSTLDAVQMLTTSAATPHESSSASNQPVIAGRAVRAEPASRSRPKDTEIMDRQMLRRIKNREAAARSNLRRKEKNDALKRSLKDARQRAQNLQARENELRMENNRLRNAVFGKSVA